MAITNLTGTSWKLNKNFNAPKSYGSFSINHIIYTETKSYTQQRNFCIGQSSAAVMEDGFIYSLGISQSVTLESGNVYTVIFTGGSNVTSQNLITWLYNNAQLIEPIKVKCSIDADSEWRQTSDCCHWNYDTIFNLTFEIYEGDLIDYTTGETILGATYNKENASTREFYYRLGEYKGSSSDYTRISTIDQSKFYRKDTFVKYSDTAARNKESWTFPLKLSDLDRAEILKNRQSDFWLPITIFCRVLDANQQYATATVTHEHLVKLPPQYSEDDKYAQSQVGPVDFMFSWKRPGLTNEIEYTSGKDPIADIDPTIVDELDGYIIKLKHKPEGTSQFVPIVGLGLGNYGEEENVKLIKLPEDTSDLRIPEVQEGEEEIHSYLGLAARYPEDTAEVYLNGPDKTKIYLNPKDFGINGGDAYKVMVYPCFHIGEHSRLSNQGIEFIVGKVSKGIVRVKTANGWVEGQVWVKTKSGWKEAESVYTKTADGWKEAQ
jgi:hypothetical protein